MLFDGRDVSDADSSSYFNGSFIRDPSVDGTYACGYVATQGPLPSTVPDFWQAMRVAQCSAVVMLTNYVDFGRAKCAPYFPEKEGEELALPGPVRIKCVHRTQISGDLVARQLEVSYPPGSPGEARQWVNHYHYTAWPDHGVPPSTRGVRALCHALDDCRRASCHIAVHCSAGVGRTGAFVAIDMLLERLQRLRLQPPGAVSACEVRAAVDVRALVVALRRQRRGMVQTGAQYEFVYHALMDDLKEGIEAGQEMLLVEAEAAAGAAAAAAAAAAAGGAKGGAAKA
ncbi:MAG: protein tyrosine phosphatase 3 [Monoraphidium minutum]|nr:MAG: protein tyrosine phosphatase 3 [Monoraphidium minutum]